MRATHTPETRASAPPRWAWLTQERLVFDPQNLRLFYRPHPVWRGLLSSAIKRVSYSSAHTLTHKHSTTKINTSRWKFRNICLVPPVFQTHDTHNDDDDESLVLLIPRPRFRTNTTTHTQRRRNYSAPCASSVVQNQHTLTCMHTTDRHTIADTHARTHARKQTTTLSTRTPDPAVQNQHIRTQVVRT